MDQKVKAAAEKFAALVEAQLARNERIKAQKEFTDYGKLDTIVIGVCGGDGIGPIITNEAARVLRHLLADEVGAGKVEFRTIDGLTIENRAAQGKAIPDDVLAELKKCHVILKGPTTTPRAGDPWPTSRAPTSRCARSSTCSPTCAPSRCRARGSTGHSSGRTRGRLCDRLLRPQTWTRTWRSTSS